jgi:phosphoadenylyl-sulfate reductase (thioredoxin)
MGPRPSPLPAEVSVHITMVKKQLASGDTCEKCAQAEEMLKRRGHWERIDEVIWAVEGDETSPGAQLAARLGVKLAPFFVVKDDSGVEQTYTSALRLAKDCFPAEEAPAKPALQREDLAALAAQLANADPQEIVRWALGRYGEACTIAFQGGDDIVLLDMATKSGQPFSVLSVDTGRLDEETYVYLDDVRRRYGVTIEFVLPDTSAVSSLVTRKGMNSFLTNGHEECCEVRRLGPLRRALAQRPAWLTAKRRRPGEESASLPVIQPDPDVTRKAGPLVRVNPLAAWSHDDIWRYIRANDVPTNELHAKGYTRIGCQPCTRPTQGVYGRAARWWWEQPEPSGDVHDSGDGI